ncbi:penicillin-binding protein [Geoalkalibacter halelectricus]|uniref:Transpeptidase family protein n=1 Tax=Geoalkalibacter halelectricus TaxID=2847045 RepID=A0ABY5ZPQ8_9BACT|nr:penicillin-binding protein [Geoalkalibacter halelectricus]MDO3378824.1 transpeptidase family protein [Geoalkalibacter halelectricus]UWZ79870.1 transpeptidase family protein [Geoalkalibacter halelectricus]
MAARPTKHPDKAERWFRIRLRLVGAVFVAAFFLVAGRAYYLQVVTGEMWQKRAEQQFQRAIPLAPQRGNIYDRSGAEMAVSLENDSIYAEPPRLGDADAAARQLAQALNLPLAEVRDKLNSRRGFVWIKRRVTPAESERVRALRLAGIDFIKEHKRYYPNSEIGAQVVGFTGLDPQGLEGLELAYDSDLLGGGGYLLMEQDALGRRMTAGNNIVREAAQSHSLHLTIDRNLQYVVERELAAQVRAMRARAGTVVLMEPATGRILAMASQPDFNPNVFWRHKPEQWRNRAISDTFEPGSTFKIFLMAAALEQGVIRANQTFFCENGRYRIGGRTIHDHRPYQNLTAAEILKVSSNIGTAKIAKILERERFHHYIERFGFGHRTGIDLRGEVTGLVRGPGQWFEIDLAAISFGQGISVTALQLASATSAIANGGRLMRPYLVERIVDGQGQVVREQTPTVMHRVVSREVAAQVRDMMVAATEQGGTGTLAAIPGFRVAGKTGTAQKVDPVTGGYSADKRVSSFVGFVPAEDPQLVMVVVLDEPQEKTYGGLVAAPVFSRIGGQALRQLGISPTLPKGIDPLPPVLEVRTPALAPLVVGEPSGEGPGRMPDLSGMSYRQVLQVMERTGLNIRLEGSGRVVEQIPRSGEKIRFDSEVRVRLAAPT